MSVLCYYQFILLIKCEFLYRRMTMELEGLKTLNSGDLWFYHVAMAEVVRNQLSMIHSDREGYNANFYYYLLDKNFREEYEYQKEWVKSHKDKWSNSGDSWEYAWFQIQDIGKSLASLEKLQRITGEYSDEELFYHPFYEFSLRIAPKFGDVPLTFAERHPELGEDE